VAFPNLDFWAAFYWGYKMRWNELEDEACSLARTVGVIGDRWTLVILRDCFLRVRQFEEFQTRLGVSRAILADRLDKLVTNFVLTKVAYQERPTRYEYRLTPKGLALYPIIMSMVHWGDTYLTNKKGRPVLHRHRTCQQIFDPVMTCSQCGEIVDPHEVEVLVGPGAMDPNHLPPRSLIPQTRHSAAKARKMQ
jgi:DNA-binding HxlR family transcriptional regulator